MKIFGQVWTIVRAHQINMCVMRNKIDYSIIMKKTFDDI